MAPMRPDLLRDRASVRFTARHVVIEIGNSQSPQAGWSNQWGEGWGDMIGSEAALGTIANVDIARRILYVECEANR
jgi:hypothetical protein